MKKLLFVFFLIGATNSLTYAQPYGNEWINYSQRYYRFPILETGVYRIYRSDLVSAGVPVAGQDPRTFQVFGRGKEHSVFIQGEADGSFDDGDYIEFYAQRNDGYLDSLVYTQPNHITNPFYSLFSDTAYYYFSMASTSSNKRFVVEADQNFANYSAAPHVWVDDIQYYNIAYSLGPTNFIQTTDPDYVSGEGWVEYNNPITIGGSVTKAFNTSNSVGGLNAWFRAGVVSLSKDGHTLRLTYPGGGQIDTAWVGGKCAKFSFNLPSASLGSNANFTFIGLTHPQVGTASNNKKVLSYVWLRYPKAPNANTTDLFRFLVEDNPSQSKYRVDVTNIQGTQASAICYDLTNSKRLVVGGSGGNFSILAPNGSGMKEIIMTNENAVNAVTTFLPCGTNGLFTNLPSQSNPKFLIVSHKTLMEKANEYATYRTSKGLPAIAIDFDELCDQFSHGIRQNPLAMRRFGDYALDTWNSSHLFIIGKSAMSDAQMKWRTNPIYVAQNLVPTWGFPCTDIRITGGLNGVLWEPNLYIGRLAAKTPEHVDIYLTKIKEYEEEQLEPQPWMKRIAHFSGGANASEQATLLSYLNSYKNVLEDTLFGGTVSTFQSNTSAPINISLTDSIRNLVNQGVSIMTFFGHAAGSGFDVSTDEPVTYNNSRKYPLIVANSCLVGDIHLPDNGQNQSEPWVILADKGAIGFLAQVTKGLQQYLHVYSTNLFRGIGYQHYQKTIGEIIRHTIFNIQNPNNELTKDNVMGMTLHGDPAIIVNSFPKPDLMVTPTSVFTTPQNITTTLDTFYLNIIITNQARAFEDTFYIEIAQTLPDGSQPPPKVIAWKGQFPNGSHFRDTLVVAFPINLQNSIGLNRFRIRLDYNSIIDEMNELNNNIELFEVLVQSPDIFPVYPYKFAIVGQQGISLKASTGNAFAPLKTYRFELDTTDSFINPIESTLISSTGGVISWAPTKLQNMPDSTVYFWRCITDSATNPGKYQWRESSFQYISGKQGMGQAHFHQFKENNHSLLLYQKPERKWEFSTAGRNLSCTNFSPTPSNFNNVEYRLDGDLIEYGFGGMSICNPYTPGVWIAVIDNTSLQEWRTYSPGLGLNPDKAYGNCFNNARTMGAFLFQTSGSPQWQDSLARFINEVVPDSFYILAYTWRYGEQQNWNDNLKNAFVGIGFSEITSITESVPWIYFTQKGKPTFRQALVAGSVNETVSLQQPLIGSYFLGRQSTPRFGPAAQWQSFHWRKNAFELPDNDTNSVSLIGITPQGIEVPLLSFPRDTDITNLSSLVNAAQYPMMKLQMYTRDDVERTPAQMDRWQLIFEGVPECALNPNLSYAFSGDTLQEFDTLHLKTAISNISNYDMDSLLVRYWIENEGNNIVPIPYPRQKPLLVGETLIDSIKFSSALLSGNNKIWVEANPNNDQAEQYHFNNIGFLSFYAIGDRINPLLDVTFDGVRILNRDIVSAKPNIVIELKDENQYLLLDDTLSADGTSLFKVLLKEPGAAQFRPIYFKNFTQMQFEPAVAGKNKCRIIYSAEFPVDGIYELVVQAKDKANNTSGQLDYKIEFEVINKSTITEILNYPNPFTTSTRFVFVLTGSVIPDNFKIQILTITGKVVKEIDQNEIGPIHIGRNVTQYAWDGTDEYGDRLANGVYLYRVVRKIAGQTIEHRSTEADDFFKKGWGKMYLMR